MPSWDYAAFEDWKIKCNEFHLKTIIYEYEYNIENKKEVIMDKSMLKDGYKVVFRNGECGYAVNSLKIIVVDVVCILNFSSYSDKLNHFGNSNCLDIMEIYNNSGNLVCKRKEEYKPSDQEIALFKLIDKKWKWIATDKDGGAFAYNNKPIKETKHYNCGIGEYSVLNLFKDVIKLTWNDEPVELDLWR